MKKTLCLLTSHSLMKTVSYSVHFCKKGKYKKKKSRLNGIPAL
jgi:hypothetical protein